MLGIIKVVLKLIANAAGVVDQPLQLEPALVHQRPETIAGTPQADPQLGGQGPLGESGVLLQMAQGAELQFGFRGMK